MNTLKTTVFSAILGSMLFTASFSAKAVGNVGLVETSGGSLNVRSSPSYSASVVKTLPRNSYVTLAQKNGNWWKVEYR